MSRLFLEVGTAPPQMKTDTGGENHQSDDRHDKTKDLPSRHDQH